MINVFVAVRAVEAVQLTQTQLRRLSPKSFPGRFFVLHVSVSHFMSSALP